jgi:hypothetical protein
VESAARRLQLTSQAKLQEIVNTANAALDASAHRARPDEGAAAAAAATTAAATSGDGVGGLCEHTADRQHGTIGAAAVG